MNIPALQLEAVWFEDISVTYNDAYVQESDEGEIELKTEVAAYGHNEDESKFLVQLIVQPEEVNSGLPYNFTLKASGVFVVSDEYLDDAARLLHITGGSMLFGSCREMLLTVTGRMARRNFKLPAVDPKEAFLGSRDQEPTKESDQD
jgi:preprotein translocase subunit SecB